MILKWLSDISNRENRAQNVYVKIVAQARHERLYSTLEVPDTVDGRFDMITLHAFMVIRRLEGEGEAASAFAQELFDAMFADMDRSLREMGVGDMGVGKRVRKFASAFYGRVQAYKDALDGKGATSREGAAGKEGEKDDKALKEALKRNIYVEGPVTAKAVNGLAGYVRASLRRLDAAPVDTIMGGDLPFAAP